ncbi:serine hydrolase domain-containing protein [Cellulophaga baltica]|uniref:CubicO group peptidase, beta-lactamase class C family n=1 Tax=Cellulophaga baltica TaxID=76594 RepID=A0A1G7LMM8_9FLAO|nr:serine hydrolase domain-containing protein [Cellulophaga baltica]SDF50663.1 CubicO group peptidase, beta-lactamase class C family [Cellulophaga baltica]
MKYTFSISILVFVFFILSCGDKDKTNSESKKPIADDYSAKLDSLILTTNPRKFNGIVLITQNGETRYSKEYGFSDFEKKTPISLNDNFRIQSNSKQITAALILKEVESGNIKLENPIREYLPDLNQSWADTVTVNQLLNMSSGVVGIEEPLAFKAGTGFHYSNPAYGLLGKILEKTTGKKYTEIANTLFKKIGMKNTYCYVPNKTNSQLSNGYWISNDTIEVVDFKNLNFSQESWSNFVPAGGIISNAHDLNIWDTKLHNGEILKPETYELMVNSKVVDSDYTFSDKDSNYGYGVNINENEPYKYIGHAGRGIGFVNLKFYMPEKQLDVIILENTYNRDIDIVYYFEKEIRKIVLNSSLVE